MSDEVRVGDRYIDGEDKITITAVDADRIMYSVMHVGSTEVWTSDSPLPLPLTWTKAGSGPKVVLVCINHPLREREPGTLYCPECVDQYAADWAVLAPAEAAVVRRTLLEQADREKDGT
jgi:hypothetical protein